MSRHPFPNGLRASWWAAGRESCLPGGLQCGGAPVQGAPVQGTSPELRPGVGAKPRAFPRPSPSPAGSCLAQSANKWLFCGVTADVF